MNPGHSTREIWYLGVSSGAQHRVYLSIATSTPVANAATRNTATHRTGKNAALRPQRLHNPKQALIKQAVDYLMQQLEACKSETLTGAHGQPEFGKTHKGLSGVIPRAPPGSQALGYFTALV